MATFEDRAKLAPQRAAALSSILAHQHMLHEVVAWMGAQKPTPELVKVVDQDEFTNDLVLRLPDVWLAYDCT